MVQSSPFCFENNGLSFFFTQKILWPHFWPECFWMAVPPYACYSIAGKVERYGQPNCRHTSPWHHSFSAAKKMSTLWGKGTPFFTIIHSTQPVVLLSFFTFHRKMIQIQEHRRHIPVNVYWSLMMLLDQLWILVTVEFYSEPENLQTFYQNFSCSHR